MQRAVLGTGVVGGYFGGWLRSSNSMFAAAPRVVDGTVVHNRAVNSRRRVPGNTRLRSPPTPPAQSCCRARSTISPAGSFRASDADGSPVAVPANFAPARSEGVPVGPARKTKTNSLPVAFFGSRFTNVASQLSARVVGQGSTAAPPDPRRIPMATDRSTKAASLDERVREEMADSFDEELDCRSTTSGWTSCSPTRPKETELLRRREMSRWATCCREQMQRTIL